MADSPPPPLQAYPLLVLAQLVAPAILVASVWLLLDGEVIDLSSGPDLLGLAAFGGLSVVVLLVSLRALILQLLGKRRSLNAATAGLTYAAPLFWVVGGVFGGWAGHGIATSAAETRAAIGQMVCADVFGEHDPRWDACLKVARACDDEADAGPCAKGQLTSAEASSRCMQMTRERTAEFTGAERELVALRSDDYADVWVRACLVERTRASVP